MANIVDIKDIDFTPYGTYLSVPNKEPEINTGYSYCWGAEYTLPLGEMRFGVEKVKYRESFSIPKLEQHRESKEISIPGDTDFIIALASVRNRLDYNEHPKKEDIVLICIHPGDILFLDEYTWHSGCFPISKVDGHYFFSYKVRNEELYWRNIYGGEIKVDLRLRCWS